MKPIDTLDSNGQITDVRQGMIYLFKSFVTSNHSQSTLYSGVQSMIWCIANNPDNPDGVVRDIDQALQVLYEAYFDNVVINCFATDLTGDGSYARWALNMDVAVTENGGKYTLARVLTDAYNAGDNLLAAISGNNINYEV